MKKIEGNLRITKYYYVPVSIDVDDNATDKEIRRLLSKYEYTDEDCAGNEYKRDRCIVDDYIELPDDPAWELEYDKYIRGDSNNWIQFPPRDRMYKATAFETAIKKSDLAEMFEEYDHWIKSWTILDNNKFASAKHGTFAVEVVLVDKKTKMTCGTRIVTLQI